MNKSEQIHKVVSIDQLNSFLRKSALEVGEELINVSILPIEPEPIFLLQQIEDSLFIIGCPEKDHYFEFSVEVIDKTYPVACIKLSPMEIVESINCHEGICGIVLYYFKRNQNVTVSVLK
jgi:hypothetical protein